MEQKKRTAEKVLEDHLHQSKHGSVEEDLARNYAEDVVLLTGRGVYRGHEGARRLNQMLQDELPKASYDYKTVLVDGAVGFLEWSARSKHARVDDGADSFVIRDGRIIAQTIHYTVIHEEC